MSDSDTLEIAPPWNYKIIRLFHTKYIFLQLNSAKALHFRVADHKTYSRRHPPQLLLVTSSKAIVIWSMWTLRDFAAQICCILPHIYIRTFVQRCGYEVYVLKPLETDAQVSPFWPWFTPTNLFFIVTIFSFCTNNVVNSKVISTCDAS